MIRLIRPAAMLLGLCAALAPVGGLAGCPPAADRGAERAELLAGLAAAPDEESARALADRLWRLWTTAPDPLSQEWLDEGMDRIRMADYAMAERILTELIAWCPGFAEAWNQRAFARFLKGDMEGALADIARTLALEPAHFGALSGRFHVLMALGRPAEARAALRAALGIHPWLVERHLLAPPGREL
ncbi:MAG: hypothetical protein KatS3mg118_0573 [Paracoccaceae bacterium]|nr:MAG: hypothetical protein KatS3mg118_0573 [Paracoccaceae bacterium]